MKNVFIRLRTAGKRNARVSRPSEIGVIRKTEAEGAEEKVGKSNAILAHNSLATVGASSR
jgi:hypothetical protein